MWTAGRRGNLQAHVRDDIAPEQVRRKLFGSRPDVGTEVTTDRAARELGYEAGHDQAPCGQEVEAAAPAVLIEDVERAAGADRARRSVKERRDRFPAAVPVIPTDRQLDQRRREVVADPPQYSRGCAIRMTTPVNTKVNRLAAAIQCDTRIQGA